MDRHEIRTKMEKWLVAWNRHDLDEVVALFSETAVFETWAGLRIEGRESIREAWSEWFGAGGFSFDSEDMIIDEAAQTVVFPWVYEGPAKCFDGRIERRRGIDLIRFRDGMIAEKITYTKTSLEVEGRRITLTSGEQG